MRLLAYSLVVLLTVTTRVLALTNEPARPVVQFAGTFNDWNLTNRNFQMTEIADQVYELKQFFTAGRYQFKFVIDGNWRNAYGSAPGGGLAQPGANLTLKIKSHGAYRIELDLAKKSWKVEDEDLAAPHAVVQVRGPVELNLPITLDASESVARALADIRAYRFWQDTNDAVQVRLEHENKTAPQAVVRLPQEATYRYWVEVNDGMASTPELVALKPHTSYQVVGDWTAAEPTDPRTFLLRARPGVFERILKSTEPGEQQLILIKDHDEGQLVANLTVSITQTTRQFWRVRYDEPTRQLQCVPEDLVEFVYRPGDDPLIKDRVKVSTVNLAGSFNGWSPTATPMTDLGDGTYVAYVKLDEGLQQYKFVVNGDVWLQDPEADPELRDDDQNGGFNSGRFIGERAKDFGPVQTDAINLAAVRHEPDQSVYFNMVSTDLAEVRLRTLAGDATRAEMHLLEGAAPAAPPNNTAGLETRPPIERVVPLHVERKAFGFDYWGTSTFVGETNKPLTYYFVLADGHATQTFGAGEDKESKTGVRPFTATLTVRFPTPDWAKNVVWYQIFPDRFRNGTPDNDPPHTLPWRWDWYKFASWETPNETKTFSGDWYSRRFGGDLQGVIDKLPYLRDLGMTALYFCPVFEAGSNHGYDTVDYRHISRYFGFTNDPASGDAAYSTTGVVGRVTTRGETLDTNTWQWTVSDKLFLAFIKQAHAQGLKVIIDGVFNHMGKGSFALQDVLTNGLNSTYADWFDVTDWGPPVKYKSWDGGGWMPNFRKDEDKGFASDSAKQYIFNITRRWMSPNGNPADGVDGWRLDVAEDIPRTFWVDWRKVVKGINPDAYITGEAWGLSPKHLRGDEWDAVMNYPFAVRAIRYFVDRTRKITASEFDRQLRELLATYPTQVDLVMQNLYDSHDTDRLANMIINPDRDYDQGNRSQDGVNYNGAKPGPDAYRVLKLMATFQMTFEGAPMIWYGDEAGMFGADDPTNRKPMLWKDLQPYDNPQDFVMDDVLNHYRRLIAIRNTYPALRTGIYQSFLTDDTNDLFGFTRTRGDQVIAVVINNTGKDLLTDLPVPFPDGSRLVDAVTAPANFYEASPASLGFPGFDPHASVRALRVNPNATAYVVHDGKIRAGLARKSAVILVKQ